MLIALSQSPITALQFFEWNDKLQKDEILVREIIDIDTNYMEDETTGPSANKKFLVRLKKMKTLVKMKMILILLLQQWKLRLNQSFKNSKHFNKRI